MAKLSLREKQCLYYARAGFTQEDSAAKLGLSVYTVNSYLTDLRLRFDCKNLYALIYDTALIEILPTWEPQ